MASTLPYVCLSNIFQHIDKDQKSLYSCTFVNKQWCMSAIPELWRSPFENHQESKKQIALINTYVGCLPQAIQQRLKISSTLTQPVTFNYPAYIRNLPVNRIFSAVSEWCSLKIEAETPRERMKKELSKALCRNFLGQAAYIDNLDITIANDFNIFRLYGASTKLPQINTLKLNNEYYSDQFNTISKICQNIQFLIICQMEYVKPTNYLDLVKIIQVQSKLQDISIDSHNFEGFKTIWNGLVNSIYSKNSLTSLTIKHIYFDSSSFTKFLQQLTRFENLEKITIKKWFIERSINNNNNNQEDIHHNQSSNFIREFKKLNTIIVKQYDLPLKILEPIFQYSSSALQTLQFIHLQNYNIEHLIDLLTNHCHNLKKFIAPMSIHQSIKIEKLFKGCQQLEYFHIYHPNFDLKKVHLLLNNNNNNSGNNNSGNDNDNDNDNDSNNNRSQQPYNNNNISCVAMDVDEYLLKLKESFPETLRTFKVYLNWVFSPNVLEQFLDGLIIGKDNGILELRFSQGLSDDHLEIVKKFPENNIKLL